MNRSHSLCDKDKQLTTSLANQSTASLAFRKASTKKEYPMYCYFYSINPHYNSSIGLEQGSWIVAKAKN